MKQTCTKILLLVGILCGISLQASTSMKAELESLANSRENMGAVVTAAKIAATQLGVKWPAETRGQFDTGMLVAKGVVQFPGYVAEAALLKDRSLMVALLEGFNSQHKFLGQSVPRGAWNTNVAFIEQSVVAAGSVLEAVLFNYVNAWVQKRYSQDGDVKALEHAKASLLRICALISTAVASEFLIHFTNVSLARGGVIDRVGRVDHDIWLEKIFPVALRCMAEVLGNGVVATMVNTEEVIKPTSEGISA